MLNFAQLASGVDAMGCRKVGGTFFKDLLSLASSNTALQNFLAKHAAGDFKKGSLIHPTAIIDPSSSVLGYLVAGKNSQIGANVKIKNAVVLPGSIVTENTEEKIV